MRLERRSKRVCKRRNRVRESLKLIQKNTYGRSVKKLFQLKLFTVLAFLTMFVPGDIIALPNIFLLLLGLRSGSYFFTYSVTVFCSIFYLLISEIEGLRNATRDAVSMGIIGLYVVIFACIAGSKDGFIKILLKGNWLNPSSVFILSSEILFVILAVVTFVALSRRLKDRVNREP